jgi:uncharacterized membrane protein YbhN (UPF0104 family)
MTRAQLLSALKTIWFLGVLGVASYYLFTNYEEILPGVRTIATSDLVISGALLVLAKLTLVIPTKLSIVSSAWTPSFFETFRINSITQLGKYLPGGVWHFVGKAGFYREQGISVSACGRYLLLENLWLIASAFTVGVLSLTIWRGREICQVVGMDCTLLGISGVWIGMLIFWTLGLYLARAALGSEYPMNFVSLLLLLGSQLGAWVLMGASLYILIPIRTGIQPALAIGGYSLGWVLGYLVVIAPSGLGVREFGVAAILALGISGNLVTVYIAVHRLVWTSVEILLGLIAQFGAQSIQGVKGFSSRT